MEGEVAIGEDAREDSNRPEPIIDRPRVDLADEMTRTSEPPRAIEGLMGIVARRLFGGERGESK